MGRAIPRKNVPRWLDEGIAQFLAVEWTNTDTFRLSVAHLMGSLIPMNELIYSWPKDSKKAHLAYLQSRTLVGYLARHKKLRQIVTYLSQGKTANQAIVLTTGMTVDRLEEEWKHYIGRLYTGVFMIFRPEVIWTLMALLFLLAYWKVKTRSNKKLKKMAIEDELEDFYEDNGPKTYH